MLCFTRAIDISKAIITGAIPFIAQAIELSDVSLGKRAADVRVEFEGFLIEMADNGTDDGLPHETDYGVNLNR